MTPAEDRAFGARLAAERLYLRNFAIRTFSREREEAEDLAQDAILSAWRARDRFVDKGPGALRAWLCMILRNKRYSDYRHEKLIYYMPIEYKFEESGDLVMSQSEWLRVSGGQEETVALHDTLRAMSKLPPHLAATLIMDARGMTDVETAVASGVAVGTAKSRLCRARRRLAEAMSDA